MTTITLDNDVKLSKTHFSNIDELKIFIYENFWYPEIKDEVEESWHKDWGDNWEEIKDIDNYIYSIKNKKKSV
jgi:hypothetical protein